MESRTRAQEDDPRALDLLGRRLPAHAEIGEEVAAGSGPLVEGLVLVGAVEAHGAAADEDCERTNGSNGRINKYFIRHNNRLNAVVKR